MTQTHPINIQLIDHVVVRVQDLAMMIGFYCEVLGCQLERGPGEYGLAQLRAGNSLVDLVDAAGPIGRQGGGAPRSEGGNMDHFCLQVHPWEEHAITAHLEEHNVEFEAVDVRYGAQGSGPSLYLKDPEGNTVELKGVVK
jgi:catechol 2,3-dioxygenase-like lactoylglutathione lyase family enzyme